MAVPYPGLRSFRRSETELFFGRDGCINAMVDRLAATRFLAVLGSSGTGKSSLVKAGLLDALELGLMARARSNWRIAEFRPEGTPLANLAREMLKIEASDAAHTDTDLNLLRTFLARGPRSIVEWCRAGHLHPGQNLLLLVDQFEELFRYRDYAGREEAEAFVSLLIESAHCAEFSIFVVITMRSEYLGACALIDGLAEEINAGMYLTPRMKRQQCREAIVGPARVCDIDIEDALVNRLLNDLASFAPWDEGDVRDEKDTQLDRMVKRADQLPLLQYTLNRMWLVARERPDGGRVTLNLSDYQGLSFSLNEHADQLFKRLDQEKCPVEAVFRALTAGTTVADAVRQPTRLDQLIEICNGDEIGVRKVLDAYRAPDCNFLLPELDPLKPMGSNTVIDISHESLIRQWKRLSDWLTKEALAAQQWRRLVDRFNVGEPLQGRELANMIAWRDEVRPNIGWAKRYGGNYPAVDAFLDKSESAETRKRWLRTGAVAVVFAVLLTAAIIALYAWQSADASLQQAELQKVRAEQSYSISKDVLGSLVLDFAERATNNMQVAEVTDLLQKAKDTLEKLTIGDPNDVELLAIHARVLDMFTDAYRRTGSYFDLSLQAADETNGVLRQLLTHDVENTEWQSQLALNLYKIGDLKLKITPKDAAGARKAYVEALAIDRNLIKREPHNEDHLRQAAIGLSAIGDLQLAERNLPEAERNYREARDIRLDLATVFSALPIYQRDLSSSYDKLAGLKIAANDLKGALAAHQEGLIVDQKILTLRYGVKAADRNNISIDLGSIAEIQVKTNDLENARKSYEQMLINDRQIAKNADNVRLQKRISKSLFAIADLQLTSGDLAGAQNSYSEAFAADKKEAQLAQEAFNSSTNSTSKEEDVINAYGHAAWSGVLAGAGAEAASYAETIVKFAPSQTWIDIIRAHAYLLLGRYDDAKAIYLANKDKTKRVGSSATFAQDIREDFAQLRKLKRGTSDIDRMAVEIGIGGT
jgi:tetratricopeptide (TPR) repeat protein